MNSLCDRALDTPKQFLDLQTIKNHIVDQSRLRCLLNLIRNYTRQWQNYLPWYYLKDQIRQSHKFYLILILFIFIRFNLYMYNRQALR